MNKKSRRNVVKGLAITVPVVWAKPVVETVIFPAHAQTTESEDNSSESEDGSSNPCGARTVGPQSVTCSDDVSSGWILTRYEVRATGSCFELAFLGQTLEQSYPPTNISGTSEIHLVTMRSATHLEATVVVWDESSVRVVWTGFVYNCGDPISDSETVDVTINDTGGTPRRVTAVVEAIGSGQPYTITTGVVTVSPV